MRFKKSPQLPGAGRTRAWHHHGSHTPTSSGAILPSKMSSKMAYHTKQIRRQCMYATYLNDIALLNLPARSVSKSALKMLPVDLLSSLEVLKSLLASV